MGGSESLTARGNPSKMGESKSISTSNMGTFVAIRGTGSNAPAPAGERGVRPAWPTVDDMPEEEEPREGEVNAEGNAPQQRADSFPFATPRIPKSVGPRAEAYTPSPPLSTRQVPQKDHAAYSLPIPNRQLTKRDLETYDQRSLNAIEAAANSAPYLRNVVCRNDLILDTELQTSNILTHFFIDWGVAELQPGFNLLRDERAWERVSNTVFLYEWRGTTLPSV
jgi:hypothetical protein